MGRVKNTLAGIAFALLLLALALLMTMPGSSPSRTKAHQQAAETMFQTATIEAQLFYDAFNSGMPIQAFSGLRQALACIESSAPEAEATCQKVWQMKATGSYDGVESLLPHLLEHMNSLGDQNPYDKALPLFVAGAGSISADTPGTIELSIAPDYAIVIRVYIKLEREMKVMEARVPGSRDLSLIRNAP